MSDAPQSVFQSLWKPLLSHIETVLAENWSLFLTYFLAVLWAIVTTLVTDEFLPSVSVIVLPALNRICITTKEELRGYLIVAWFLLGFGWVGLGLIDMGRRFFVETTASTIARLSNTLSELGIENESLSASLTMYSRNIVQDVLRQIGSQLDFGNEEHNTERITLYVTDTKPAPALSEPATAHVSITRFVPIGRYSANPEFAKPGRSEYPSNEGCMAVAWQHGWHFDNAFPNPSTDLGAYCTYQRDRYQLPQGTLDRLNMKACLYCAMRVSNAANSEHIAIVIVEATQRDRFTEGVLRKRLDEHAQLLFDVVLKLRPFLAVPSVARKAGF